MSINWQNLRTFNGSQNSAFEELCCQLAAYEEMPTNSKFIRKGAPDAGLECYWKLPNGNEWGLQAKFFLFTPEDSQWRQISQSVETALTKHQNLTRYIVALPIDRQDPRIENEKWFMDKWEENVKRWKELASLKRMNVEFDFWGQHEIFERLSREEHKGRYYFWFHQELFSQSWFESRIEETIANVGPRYTPELNVKLPIASYFHSLGRTPEFYNEFTYYLKNIRKSHSHIWEIYLPESYHQISEVINNLSSKIKKINQNIDDYINWETINNDIKKAFEIVEKSTAEISTITTSQSETVNTKEEREKINHLNHLSSNYWNLYQKLKELQEYISCDEVSLSNMPALLLVGEAGKGKTHLFCDIAKQRIQSRMPTLLLIGCNFNLAEPWSQIISQLGLQCTKEEFLGALEAAAQANRNRAVILIDALNEGQGRSLWRNHLAGILLTLSNFPWLGISVSVRTSYEDLVVPDGLVPNKLIRIVHHGFSENEYNATKTFFSYYGIQRPTIPMLVPEFQNPLFLKIFCLGLRNSGLARIPQGLQGITAIFKFFLDSINKKLSSPDYLDFNPRTNIVLQVVEKLAAMYAEKGEDWLNIKDAENTINQILPRDNFENSLYRHLVSEGVITENRLYIGNNIWTEVVQFAYERFSDHLIAKYLLDKYFDPEKLDYSFSKDSQLGKYVQGINVSSVYQGLIEAFSIQLPERIDKELFELVPSIKGFHDTNEAFINSLIWRDPKHLQVEQVVEYANKYITRDKYYNNKLIDALLTIAGNPDHPLNALFLHTRLLNQELAIRDAWWTLYVNEHFGDHGSIDRLVEWAWTLEDKMHISDNSIRLCGIILTWFFTASNRFLRDQSTKAMVQLFTERIDVLISIIKDFSKVNDLYVLERLMAVAYGCSMRSQKTEVIGKLAIEVYNLIFEKGVPPANILLRDFARGVVEIALNRGANLYIDLSKIRPPYGSKFLRYIPSKEKLKSKYDNFGNVKNDIDYAQSEIWSSVMGFGDFARYIIGTNSHFFEWSSIRIGEIKPPSLKEKYEKFISSLTKTQIRKMSMYKDLLVEVSFSQIRFIEIENDKKKAKLLKSLEKQLRNAKKSLMKSFGKEKLKIFKKDIIKYLNNSHVRENQFDLSIAQRWILKRVFELGWTVEKFGYFDRYINYNSSRDSHKSERIGKKYQWIAYYEFLARVADNFQFHGDEWVEPKITKYEGPWQGMYLRNIDPSFVLSRTNSVGGWHGFKPTWWAPPQVLLDDSQTDKEWVNSKNDLPKIENLLEVHDSADGLEWLILESFYDWVDIKSDDDLDEYPKRNIWYSIKSYITKKHDANEVFKWLNQKMLTNSNFELPTSDVQHSIYIGEYYWAPSFLYHNIPYYNHDGWTQGYRGNKIPRPILLTSDTYGWDGNGYDCSLEDSVNISIPCKFIADLMGFNWNGKEGYYFDENNELIAFDPSVNNEGPSALLINSKKFEEFLEKEGYSIIWTIVGEKSILYERTTHDWPGRLEIKGVYILDNGNIKGKMKTFNVD